MRKERIGNELRARFMTVRAEEINKRNYQIAREIGMDPGQYSKMRKAGFLPEDPKKVEALAKALLLSVDQLCAASLSPVEDKNIASVVLLIAEARCSFVTIEDIKFVSDFSKDLKKRGLETTSIIVGELMKLRHPELEK